jgi:hypothetical protein
MADAVTVISDNIVWIILAVLGAIVIITVVLQWKKVRETQNNVKLVGKQVELKKISLVEKDLETKRMMENVIPLPNDQQESLAKLRDNTSNIMQKVGYLHGEIGERVALLEAKVEYGKLQKLLNDLEKKEKDIDKKADNKLKGR